MTASLPIPDAIAQAHSRALVHKLKQAADQAPLLFSSYMQRCLYEPGLGYYMAGSQKFGAEGDFVTVIKDLKVKGSSAVVKVGTKVKNIRVLDADYVADGHDIDCKIDGFGALKLKSSVVKKN